jgi:16S rRNA (adenine1518-N6/adenine1519-N6)-dimethyltransferase
MYGNDVSKYLKDNNFFPSKKLGQNFLINQELAKAIVDSVNYENVDVIIEIGPGLCALTNFLVKKHIPYIGIELDKRLHAYCQQEFPNHTMINDDVLEVDMNALLKERHHPVIISNLPYVISSQVILKFLQLNISFNQYFMLQKEMVERLCAKTRNKDYNGLTVILNEYASIDKLLTVNRNNFNPIPQVDSQVICIKRNNKIYNTQFVEFVRQCFMQKRKTLVNNLKSNHQKDKIVKTLRKFKFSETIRAEELSSQQLLGLFNCLVS